MHARFTCTAAHDELQGFGADTVVYTVVYKTLIAVDSPASPVFAVRDVVPQLLNSLLTNFTNNLQDVRGIIPQVQFFESRVFQLPKVNPLAL